MNKRLAKAQRWVVKIGSALLTNDGKGLAHGDIAGWVAQIAELHKQNKQISLVSSGAVAAGMTRLGWATRPTELYRQQAAAAVGQMGVIQTYEACFQQYGIHTAQILLTHDDMSNRERYLNARSVMRALLDLRVAPVVNENDTVATSEIQFGDNDTLGGLVANLIEADLMVILTDQLGLYSADPRQHPDATLIPEGRAGDKALYAMASSSGGSLGRGGMYTKLRAAELAARSGTITLIASGREPDVLKRIANGENPGTILLPSRPPLAARKRWLASQLHPAGNLHLDAGAAHSLRHSGRSLLAVGVTGVEGAFRRGDIVSCVDPDGMEMARGLVNYNADEAAKIRARPSEQIMDVLGYTGEPELIHRDNLVLLE
ncbi:MAG: glutamate 5-kinase [Pseudomonadota bacterium]